MMHPAVDIAAPAAARRLKICNQKGLHARAAAKFVKLAESFDADIVVCRLDMNACGRSIMGLMMLAAAMGCEVALSATGPQADAALDALTALINDRFGEEE